MTSPRAVLIVDADPHGLESLVYGFQGADWRLTACPAPETATLLVKASGAQIVVIASRSEHEKMVSLVRQLRNKEATRALPILVLGPEDQRPLLREVGDIDLLPLPAFVRDVLTASELLSATGLTAAQQPGEEPLFRGSISSVHTLSLVRTMNGLCRSGQLRLERHGRTGEILFHQGEMTAASIGALQAMAAAQHLMVWNDGKLELRLRPVPRRGQMHLSAQEFMQELDRFQRDYAHAMKAIGPASTVYATSPERLRQAGGAVPAEVTPVVRLCDGRRALSDIIDESPFRVLDTVRILGRLAELGVLTHADGKPVTSGYPEPSTNDEFLDTAKITGAARAWPMPAPIGGFPTPPASLPETPPSPLVKAPAFEAPMPTPTSTSPAPPAKDEGRPRKQTLELGVPAPQASPLARTPAPVHAGRTPAPVRVSEPAAPVQSLAVGQIPATMAVEPPPPAPAVPAPPTSAPSGVIVVGKPASPNQPETPVVTTTQASGTAGGKRISSSLAAKLVPTTARASALMAAQTDSPAPGPTAASSGAISGALVAGVIESRKSERRSQQSMRAVADHPRVIIESLAAEPVKTPLPSTSQREPMPSPSPDVAAAASVPGRVTGVLQVAASRKLSAQTTPPARASIQIDVSLSEPAHSNSPTPPLASAPIVARATGEMNVAPSGRTTRSMGKTSSPPSSFQIDPSLTGKDAPSTPAPLRRNNQPPAGFKRRPSGNFSAVESDFFEREADLYKEEKPESFADLDAGKAKPGGKTGGKPNRPYRK